LPPNAGGFGGSPSDVEATEIPPSEAKVLGRTARTSLSEWEGPEVAMSVESVGAGSLKIDVVNPKKVGISNNGWIPRRVWSRRTPFDPPGMPVANQQAFPESHKRSQGTVVETGENCKELVTRTRRLISRDG
jgi:hypothetical protein